MEERRYATTKMEISVGTSYERIMNIVLAKTKRFPMEFWNSENDNVLKIFVPVLKISGEVIQQPSPI